MEKGQVSIFVIIGMVVLIIFVAIAFIIMDKKTEIRTSNPAETDSVKQYLQFCALESLKKSTILAGNNGFYYSNTKIVNELLVAINETNPNSTMLQNYSIPMMFLSEKYEEFTLAQVEEGINRNIKHNYLKCLNNFSSINKIINVTYDDDLSSKVTITEKEIYLDIKQDININQNDEQIIIREITQKHKYSINNAIFVTNELIKKLHESSEFIPITYLTEIASNENLKVKLKYLDDYVIYTFIFPDFDAEENENLEIKIAGKYEW